MGLENEKKMQTMKKIRKRIRKSGKIEKRTGSLQNLSLKLGAPQLLN